MLLAALNAAEKRRWLNLCTGDESWMMWVNRPTESWTTIDEALPQRVLHAVGATKSILTVFCNPKEFAIIDLLPQDTSFTAVYFVNNMILALAKRYVQQLGAIGHRKLHLHFDNSKRHTARHIKKEMAHHRRCVLPTAVFTRPGHRRFLSIWPIKATTLREDLGQ
jgi:hypothetical protein